MSSNQSLIKYYMRIFFYVFISFTLSVGFFGYLVKGELDWIGPLTQGIMFGIGWSYFIGRQQISALKKIGITEFTDEVLAVNQSDNFELEITTDQLISKLENNPIENFKSMEVSGQSIQMCTRGHLDALSGEKIQIDFKDLDNGIKAISINSKPRIFFQQFDQGRNIINVRTIRNVIEP